MRHFVNHNCKEGVLSASDQLEYLHHLPRELVVESIRRLQQYKVQYYTSFIKMDKTSLIKSTLNGDDQEFY